MQEDVAGTLRIAAPSILARYFLPKLLGRFQDMYPKTKFDVQIAQSSDVISLASSLGIHFGFVRNDFDWREDERVLLTTNHVCAVAAQPFKLEDLPHMVRVDYDTDNIIKIYLMAGGMKLLRILLLLVRGSVIWIFVKKWFSTDWGMEFCHQF